MTEDKMFEKVKAEQDDAGAMEVWIDEIKKEEKDLDELLPHLDQKEAQQMQSAFDEYRKLRKQLFEQRGDFVTTDDIKELSPDNLWVRYREAKIESEVENTDFDEMWKNVKEEVWGEENRNKSEEEKQNDLEKWKEADEDLLKHVLDKSSVEESQKIIAAFEEYKKVRDEVIEVKGADADYDDIKARIPDNQWMKILYTPGEDEDEDQQLDDSGLEEAKKNNQIN